VNREGVQSISRLGVKPRALKETEGWGRKIWVTTKKNLEKRVKGAEKEEWT